MRLSICADSSEPSLLTDVKSTNVVKSPALAHIKFSGAEVYTVKPV